MCVCTCVLCGRTNELTHAVRTECSCDSSMADRMGLGTMLHYLAVWKAMVNIHKPVHSKITLTYSLTRRTFRRMALKALLNAKVQPFPSLCSSFLCAYCSKKNCQNGLLLKNSYVFWLYRGMG